MGSRSKEFDDHIRGRPDFARPILERIRKAFHQGCPDLTECIKWGMPVFEHQGILGGMASFQAHVNLFFWKGQLMPDPDGLFQTSDNKSMASRRVETLKDLPTQRILVKYVKEAVALNETKAKPAGKTTKKKAARLSVPKVLKDALAKNAKARATFEGFPPSRQREYIEWITEAKKDETRDRRLGKAVTWMAEGKSRNWKYRR